MDDRDRQNLFAAIAVIVIIGLSFWLLHLWSEHIKMENCVLSGRSYCHTIPLDE